MEDKKAKIIALSLIISLIITIIIAHIYVRASNTYHLILGADLASIFAILAFIIVRERSNRRKTFLETQRVSEGRELRIEYSFLRRVAGVPTKFKHKELEEATNNFSSLLGKGSSGSVYKGVLNDGTSIAVKRILGEDERGEKEFKSEIAAIASVQHTNLVRILGYCCVQTGPRFIVYEFFPKGSLDKWIFHQKGSYNCLAWENRVRVAIDVARALSYLHHDCRSRILHLDVKPENILLDENFRGIVSDFGLSKLMGRDESKVVTTVRGTKGYLAPEWLLENGISEKSDVYSFGMVVLEMIGGRRNIRVLEKIEKEKEKKTFEYFPKIVIEKLREGKVMDLVDKRVLERGGIDEREVKKLVCVALWCIQEKARLRPSMVRVVEMLDGRAPVDVPPHSQMVMVDLLSIEQDEGYVGYVGYGRQIPSSSSSYSFAMSVLSGR